ncbi:MAG: hypothetical protein AB7V43_11805 [Acidimicrobiia bacterium]
MQTPRKTDGRPAAGPGFSSLTDQIARSYAEGESITTIMAWYGLSEIEIEIALADAGVRAYPEVFDRIADVRAALAQGLPAPRLAVLLGIGLGDLLSAIEWSFDVDLRTSSDVLGIIDDGDGDVIVLP